MGTECLGIKIVLTNENKDDTLSENASNKNIVKCFDTSEVTNMDYFLLESNINADLSSWDVSSVTSMNEMFRNVTTFNSDVSDWDVSSVKDMEFMFRGATKFNCDVSDWDVSSLIKKYIKCSSSCCPGSTVE